MHKYANAAKRKRYKWIAVVVGIVVMAPAIYTFINVYKENKINNQIVAFVKLEIKKNDYYKYLDHDPDVDKKILEINLLNEIGDAEINSLENRMNTDPRYSELMGWKVIPIGKGVKSYELISTAYEDKREELRESKIIIKGLEAKLQEREKEIADLNYSLEQDGIRRNQKVIAFSRISKEAKIRYHEIMGIGFANVLSTKDFIKIDTIPQITIKWNLSVPDSVIGVKERELSRWLRSEMQLDTLFIKREK